MSDAKIICLAQYRFEKERAKHAAWMGLEPLRAAIEKHDRLKAELFPEAMRITG